MVDRSNPNPDHRKKQLIEAAILKASQLTPSVDIDETQNDGVDQDKGLSRCPSCFADIETDSLLDSMSVNCVSCQTMVYLSDTESLNDVPTQFGSFQLVKRLGTGAFGQVWLADDNKLDRQVAIKFPKAARMSREYRELFYREARNAAQLRHPNVVSVFEVGEEAGLTYIVSEYINAEPLDRWVRKNRIAFRESAQLCLAIADALQAAHSRQIVHRDLKPSNILIDQRNQPYITDFGLSKRQSDLRAVDVQGRVLGTPAYMSPEQASGDSISSDGRSDIYSLGVILFELLTGEKPFRGDSKMLIETVKHELPPRPRSLNSQVPADLETICLKCMEKKPTSRYQTAGKLAEDLQRWMDNKPIQARPAGNLERSIRWCQRNKVVAGLTVAVITALAAGLVGVTWQWQKTKTALAIADHQTDRGDRLLTNALDVVDDVLLDFSINDDALKRNHGSRELRQKLLERAHNYYQSFVDTEQSQRASSRMVQALKGLAFVSIERRDFSDAREFAKQGIKIANQLIANNVEPARNRRNLGRLHGQVGRTYFEQRNLDLAESELDKSIRVASELLKETEDPLLLNDLCSSYDQKGSISFLRLEYRQSTQFYRMAEELIERLQADPGHMGESARNLATIKLNRANSMVGYDPVTTGRLLDEAMQILWKTPNQEGGESQAVAMNSESIRVMIEQRPAYWAREMARAIAMKSNVQSRRNQIDQSLKSLGLARNLHEHLLRYEPENVDYLHFDAKALTQMGMIHGNRLKPKEAIACFDDANRIFDKLKITNPEDFDINQSWIFMLERSSTIYMRFGDSDQAVSVIEDALKLRQEVIDLFPDIKMHQYLRALTCLQMGNLNMHIGQADIAMDYLRQGEKELYRLVDEKFEYAGMNAALASAHNGMANCCDLLKDRVGELKHARKSYDIRKANYEASPRDSGLASTFQNAQTTMGLALVNNEQFSEASEMLQGCLDFTHRNFSRKPEYLFLTGSARVNLASALKGEKNFVRSLEESKAAMDELESVVKKHPDLLQASQFLDNAKGLRALTLREYVDLRVKDGFQAADSAAIVDDAIESCALTEWNDNDSIAALVGTLIQAVAVGGDLEELLRDVPEKVRPDLKSQVEKSAEESSEETEESEHYSGFLY